MKNPLLLTTWAFLAPVLLTLGSQATAATAILTAVADTSLYQNHSDSNLGGTTLVSGANQQFSNSRALFQFDLSAIPTGSTIEGAQVMLTVTRRPDPDQHTGPLASDFGLYRVLQDWGEGTGLNVTGSNAQPGDATWNERHFASASWSSPGGVVGTDFAAEASASTSIDLLGSYSWGSTGQLVSDVQSWLDDPQSNFGFVLISDQENRPGSARRFASRELPGADVPGPQLTVTYSLTVPEPSRALLCLSGVLCLLAKRRRT